MKTLKLVVNETVWEKHDNIDASAIRRIKDKWAMALRLTWPVLDAYIAVFDGEEEYRYVWNPNTSRWVKS